MPELLRMPEVAAGTEAAKLVEWLLDEGAAFTSAQPLATIETDKAVVDFTPESEGVLLRKLTAAGTDVAVGDAIALVAAPSEVVDDVDAALAALGVGVDAGPAVASRETAPAVASVARTFTSPLARRLANEAGIEPASINGTGPNGRIVRADVEQAIRARVEDVAPPEPPPRTARDQAVSRSRRAIAGRLSESKRTVPHFYVRGRAEVEDLIALREQLNRDGETKLSINDFVLKAVGKAHRTVPAMNVIWDADTIRQFDSVDVGVAIATPSGLVSPVIQAIERMPISMVAATTRDFAERARSGRLYQHELEGGSSTVTNLGMYGLEEFTAIINPPQSSILAVGAVRKEPVVTSQGAVQPRAIIRVVLSVDHRPVDGVVAAEWMRAFLALLTDPIRILS